jgi:hypothetical protein
MTRRRKAPQIRELHDHTSHSPLSPKQQLAQARQAHAKGTMGMEDYIWTAMQCYAADNRSAGRR